MAETEDKPTIDIRSTLKVMALYLAEWQCENTTVFAANRLGVNRFSASVQPGQDNLGNRVDEGELKAVAQAMAAAPRMLSALITAKEQILRMHGPDAYDTLADIEDAIHKATGAKQ